MHRQMNPRTAIRQHSMPRRFPQRRGNRESLPMQGERSRALRDLRYGVRVERHLLRDALVGDAADNALVGDDEAHLRLEAAELLALPDLEQLLCRAVQLNVAAQIGVRIEQHDVEALDLAVLLEATVVAH